MSFWITVLKKVTILNRTSHTMKRRLLFLDEMIVKELEPWRQAVDKTGRQYVGEARVLIDHSNCKKSECNAGNFVTDVMIESVSICLLFYESYTMNI